MAVTAADLNLDLLAWLVLVNIPGRAIAFVAYAVVTTTANVSVPSSAIATNAVWHCMWHMSNRLHTHHYGGVDHSRLSVAGLAMHTWLCVAWLSVHWLTHHRLPHHGLACHAWLSVHWLAHRLAVHLRLHAGLTIHRLTHRLTHHAWLHAGLHARLTIHRLAHRLTHHAWLHAWLHVLYSRLDTWLWLVAAISVLGRTIASLGLLTDRLLLWHVASISVVSLRLLWHTLRLLLVLNRLLLGLGWLLHWLGLLSGFLL